MKGETKSRYYIQDLIAEGEHEQQDFKHQITDAAKIARSISAFANRSGGRLLIGVKDNGRICGISSEEEIYMIDRAATACCMPSQQVEYHIYRVEGKTVLKVDIPPSGHLPVRALDEHHRWRAYIRVADENILASKLQMAVWRSEGSDTIELGEKESALLDLLQGENDTITLRQFSIMAHITERTAIDTVAAMCRAGILRLIYRGKDCLIGLSPKS